MRRVASLRLRLVVPLAFAAVVVAAVAGCAASSGGPGSNAEADPGAHTGMSASVATEPTMATSPTATTPTAPLPVPSTETTSTTAVPPAPEESILAVMTLRQKAAQVLLLSFSGTTLTATTAELLALGPPGGLLLLGPNVTDAEQLADLTQAVQEEAAGTVLGVGLFIAVDQEGGSVRRIREGVPDLPGARVLGDRSTPVEAGRLAAATATGLLQQGVNMNLAPVADVVADKASFLYNRSFSGDPAVVAEYVTAVTRAFVSAGLITVVKHFPGHGSAPGDTHGQAVISDIGRRDFERIHLPPFQAAIDAGAEGVMLSHIVATAYDPADPGSQSKPVIERLLREELGFQGLAVSDDLSMAAASAPADESRADGPGTAAAAAGRRAVNALRAGCDLLISTGTLEQHVAVIEAIMEAVVSGDLPAERLDQAVLRILRLKSQQRLLSR